jgi:hypothetical protein
MESMRQVNQNQEFRIVFFWGGGGEEREKVNVRIKKKTLILKEVLKRYTGKNDDANGK